MNKLKKIAKLDLSIFKKPMLVNSRGFLVRAVWYAVSGVFFQSYFSLLPSFFKGVILRCFGAKIGKEVVIKPRVSIKSPWFLEVGDNVWLGEMVWIDNHTLVRIGSNSCISQGAYIFTGNHDWNDPAFSFFCKPVNIGEGVWITAFQRVAPGSDIPSGVAVVSSEV